MYNSYLMVHGYENDPEFLKFHFIPVMLNALGLNDTSGVIYQLIEYAYFQHNVLGSWDAMMPGMVNVRVLKNCLKSIECYF